MRVADRIKVVVPYSDKKVVVPSTWIIAIVMLSY